MTVATLNELKKIKISFCPISQIVLQYYIVNPAWHSVFIMMNIFFNTNEPPANSIFNLQLDLL